MKISELIQLLNDYEKRISTTQSDVNDALSKILKMQEYLKNKKEDGQLDQVDILYLLELTSFNDASPLCIFLKEKLDKHKLFDIYHLLQENNLIDKDIISFLIRVDNENKNAINFFHRLFFEGNFKKDQFSNVILALKEMAASSETILRLYSLSISKINHFYDMICQLVENSLLNQDSFRQALNRITTKLPHVTQSSVVKKSKRTTRLPRSEILLNGDHTFFIDQTKEVKKGGFGIVKKAYTTVESAEPAYSIKKLIKSSPENTIEKDAIREVTLNRLLNHPSHYFSRNNTWYVTAKWRDGQDLQTISTDQLLQYSYENRLKMLLDCLSDLDTLHQYNLIHGDIKPTNVIVNFNSLSMKLIDGGGAIKCGSKKMPLYSLFYQDRLPPDCEPNHFYSDLYGMSIIAKMLFPELYESTCRLNDKGYFVIDTRASFRCKINAKDATKIEKAIFILISSMSHDMSFARCTSAEAKLYCQTIVNELPSLDLKKLNSIINADTVSVEDILRERTFIFPERKSIF